MDPCWVTRIACSIPWCGRGARRNQSQRLLGDALCRNKPSHWLKLIIPGGIRVGEHDVRGFCPAERLGIGIVVGAIIDRKDAPTDALASHFLEGDCGLGQWRV